MKPPIRKKNTKKITLSSYRLEILALTRSLHSTPFLIPGQITTNLTDEGHRKDNVASYKGFITQSLPGGISNHVKLLFHNVIKCLPRLPAIETATFTNSATD